MNPKIQHTTASTPKPIPRTEPVVPRTGVLAPKFIPNSGLFPSALFQKPVAPPPVPVLVKKDPEQAKEAWAKATHRHMQRMSMFSPATPFQTYVQGQIIGACRTGVSLTAPMIAAGAATFGVQPLVYARTHIQVNSTKESPEPLGSAIKKAGVRGVLRGASANVQGSALGTGSTPVIKKVLHDKTGHPMLSWVTAGYITGVLQNPYKFAGTQMSARQLKGQSTYQVMGRIIKEHGVVALLTRGLGVTVLGKVIFLSAVSEWSRPLATEVAQRTGGEAKPYEFVAGLGLGMAAAAVIYPLDAYRTHLQTGTGERLLPLVRRLGLTAYKGVRVQMMISGVYGGLFAIIEGSLKDI